LYQITISKEMCHRDQEQEVKVKMCLELILLQIIQGQMSFNHSQKTKIVLILILSQGREDQVHLFLELLVLLADVLLGEITEEVTATPAL